MKRAMVGAFLLLCFLVCLFTTAPCFGQANPSPVPSSLASPLIANVGGRTAISLDGTWNSIIDPYESGLGSRFYENAKPKSKSDLIEYDFDRSPKLRVPGDWNTQRDSLLFYEGVIWYQRYFSYQKKEHTRSFLYFGAANYQARVWLNGIKLGEHEGGFTPFDFEVTDKIADGENSVVVEVNNTRLADGVPSTHTDWWNYGGLTRSVQLIEEPEAFIQNYAVHLAKGGGRIEGWVKVNGGPATGTVLSEEIIDMSPVTVEIPEIHLKQTAPVDASGRAALSFPAKVELWSPENPKLYHVIISGHGDSVSDDIGFRTIETRGTQILLNGKPTFLRGICIHEEAPFRSGRAFSTEDDATLLGWAKELGANFVRLAHYPHNEEMIRLADRMGLLVWEEVPAYWDIDWKNPATLDNAKAQMDDVIARDQNRAAVAMWSMSNETPISPERTVFLKAMADYARQLDSTRLITSALNRTEHAGDVRTLNDPLAESLDVIGVNEYIGWYEGKPEDADRTQWKFAVEKPVIISEFGGSAQYGLHADAETRFSEEYQANLFQHQIGMVQKIPELAGITPWVLMDFRSPRRFLPGIQDYFNRKGLVSDRGQKKQAFYVLQKFYQEKQQQAAAH